MGESLIFLAEGKFGFRASTKMATYKAKGIILRKTNFGEADQLVSIFTDTEGKIKVKAKGVRRLFSKNRGHLDLFSYSDLVIAKGKELDTLVSASTIESFKNIKADLKKTALAYYFAELCDKLTAEKEENRKVFDLLLEVLRFLDKAKLISIVARYFELNLLAALGYAPELYFCVHCRRKLQPVSNFFSPKLGGMLCDLCSAKLDSKSLKISPTALKALRILLAHNLETVLKFNLSSVEKEIDSVSKLFLRYVAEREFKSIRFIEKLKNPKH